MYILLIFLTISFILVFYYIIKHKRKKLEMAEIDKKIEKNHVEDLRTFVKHGVHKGYRIKELIKELKKNDVDTELIEKMIEKGDFSGLNKTSKNIHPEKRDILNIKEFVDKLSKEEKEKIHKQLDELEK